MPLTTQQGEVAGRLRTFFRLTGRIPSSVDETVVPTARVQSLDQPPYRVDVSDFAENVLGAAVALELTGVGLYVPGALVKGAAVIDSVVFTNSSAGSLTFALIVGFADIGSTSFPGFTPGGPGVSALDDMRVAGNATTRFLPVREFTAHNAALFGQEILRVTFLSGGHLYVPWRLTLRPGFGCAVYCTTVNTGLLANFHGTWYPDVD